MPCVTCPLHMPCLRVFGQIPRIWDTKLGLHNPSACPGPSTRAAHSPPGCMAFPAPCPWDTYMESGLQPCTTPPEVHLSKPCQPFTTCERLCCRPAVSGGFGGSLVDVGCLVDLHRNCLYCLRELSAVREHSQIRVIQRHPHSDVTERE